MDLENCHLKKKDNLRRVRMINYYSFDPAKPEYGGGLMYGYFHAFTQNNMVIIEDEHGVIKTISLDAWQVRFIDE